MYSCWVLFSSIEYFSINTNLPPTAYVKMIDVWLLFFLISTTINICIHILVDFLRKSELEFERVHGAARPTTVKVGQAYMHGEVMIRMAIGR